MSFGNKRKNPGFSSRAENKSATRRPAIANDDQDRAYAPEAAHINLRSNEGSSEGGSGAPSQTPLPWWRVASQRLGRATFGASSRDANRTMSAAGAYRRIINTRKAAQGKHAAMMGPDNGLMPFNTTGDVPICMFRGMSSVCNSVREMYWTQIIIPNTPSGVFTSQAVGITGNQTFTYPCTVLAFRMEGLFGPAPPFPTGDSSPTIWCAIVIQREGTTLKGMAPNWSSTTQQKPFGPTTDVVAWDAQQLYIHGGVYAYMPKFSMSTSRRWNVYKGDALNVATNCYMNTGTDESYQIFGNCWIEFYRANN